MLETVLLAGGFMLMVFCVYTYIRAEDNSYEQFAQYTKDIKLMNESLSKQIEGMAKNQESSIKIITEALDIHSKQIKELENKKQKPEDPLLVKMSEPLSINVVYSPKKTKPLIPTDPPKKSSGVNSPLSRMIDRAGIKSKDN